MCTLGAFLFLSFSGVLQCGTASTNGSYAKDITAKGRKPMWLLDFLWEILQDFLHLGRVG